MTTPTPETRTAILRELFAATLVLLGLGGVVGVLFALHPLAGIAAVSVTVAGFGLFLATGKE